MNNKRLYSKSVIFLHLPTLAIISALLLFSLLSEILQQGESSLMLAVYYISRALSYALYFMWCSYICVMLLHKKIIFSVFLAVIFFVFNLTRIFLSFVFSNGTFVDSLVFLSPSALGALSECITVFLLCLISFAVLFVFHLFKYTKRKQNVTFSKADAATVFSLSSSGALFFCELITEISYTVDFVSAQLGVIYKAEMWSIAFDYIFLLIILLMGYFISSLYIQIADSSLKSSVK